MKMRRAKAESTWIKRITEQRMITLHAWSISEDLGRSWNMWQDLKWAPDPVPKAQGCWWASVCHARHKRAFPRLFPSFLWLVSLSHKQCMRNSARILNNFVLALQGFLHLGLDKGRILGNPWIFSTWKRVICKIPTKTWSMWQVYLAWGCCCHSGQNDQGLAKLMAMAAPRISAQPLQGLSRPLFYKNSQIP